MAFGAKARVEVTATVSGTGAVTSMVANTSRIDFSFLSDADYTYGYIEQGSLWEECTLTKSGSTLVRSNVTASSSGGSSVSFNGSSSSTCFVDIPLSKLLIAQADGTFANADALLGTVTLNTLTALKNAPLPASTGYARYVRGLASATDGNGGWYYWDSADATAGDDYLYVVSNVSGTGRWIRVKQQLDPATAANDGAVKTGAVARVSTYLRSKHATHGALYVPEAYSYVKAIFDTYAAFKAVASTVWANGDRVAFNGITAKNDAPYHEGVYASASTNTDALDILFLRPDDISGSNPGRLQFTEPPPIATFADGDSSPTVKGARNFRASDAGTTITALDDAIDLQTYTIFPGAANTQFTHSSSFVMPGNANFTLYTAANGGSPVQIRYDNGIGYLMGGGGGSSDIAVYDTRAAAIAATVPSTVKRIRTLGRVSANDNGGAEYKRVGSGSSAWHLTSADTQIWEIDQREWTLEMVGCVGDASTDNTTALQAMSTAINTPSLQIKRVLDKDGATYYCCTAAAGGTIFDLNGVDGVELNFGRSLFSARFASLDAGARWSFLIVRGGSSRNTAVINGEQPNYLSTGSLGGSPLGIDWITEKTGANSNNYVLKAVGGDIGYACIADLNGSDARVRNSSVVFEVKDVYYPVNLQSQGDNVTMRGYADNPGRPYLIYNCSGWHLDITHRNSRSQAVVEVYGNNNGTNLATEGWTLIDRDYDSAFGSVVGNPIQLMLSNNYPSNSTNDALRLAGKIHVERRLQADGNGHNQIIDTTSFVAGGSAGDTAGSSLDIEISGRIIGTLAGSDNAFTIGAAADGFSSNTRVRVVLTDFEAPTLARPMSIGQYASVHLGSVYAPSMALSFAGSYAGVFSQSNSASTSTYANMGVATEIVIVDGSTERGRIIGDSSALYLRGFNSFALQANGGADQLFYDGTALYPFTDVGDALGKTTNLFSNVFADQFAFKYKVNQQSSNYTLVLGDAGKMVQNTNSGTAILTIPPNASVAFPIGTFIELNCNGGASSTWQVERGSGVTLYRAGTSGTDGNIQVPARRRATLTKIDTNVWTIEGTGLTDI